MQLNQISSTRKEKHKHLDWKEQPSTTPKENTLGNLQDEELAQYEEGKKITNEELEDTRGMTRTSNQNHVIWGMTQAG